MQGLLHFTQHRRRPSGCSTAGRSSKRRLCKNHGLIGQSASQLAVNPNNWQIYLEQPHSYLDDVHNLEKRVSSTAQIPIITHHHCSSHCHHHHSGFIPATHSRILQTSTSSPVVSAIPGHIHHSACHSLTLPTPSAVVPMAGSRDG